MQHALFSHIKPYLIYYCNTFFCSNLTTSFWTIYAEDTILPSNRPGHSSYHSYDLHMPCCRHNKNLSNM